VKQAGKSGWFNGRDFFGGKAAGVFDQVNHGLENLGLLGNLNHFASIRSL
jgi:hypothetical protein